MSCHYWTWQWNDPASGEDSPSPYWPHPASLATGFLEITTEMAVSYWMSRVRVEDEESQTGNMPPAQSSVHKTSDESDFDCDTSEENLPSDRSRDKANKKNLKISRESGNNGDDSSDKRQMIPKCKWPGYTLFEQNGIPTVLILPRAFSTSSAHTLQEFGLPPPRRSTKPSELTLLGQVTQTRMKRRLRQLLLSARARRRASNGPCDSAQPMKKPRLTSANYENESSDEDGDSGMDSGALLEFSNSIVKDSILESEDDDLYCYESIMHSP